MTETERDNLLLKVLTEIRDAFLAGADRQNLREKALSVILKQQQQILEQQGQIAEVLQRQQDGLAVMAERMEVCRTSLEALLLLMADRRRPVDPPAGNPQVN